MLSRAALAHAARELPLAAAAPPAPPLPAASFEQATVLSSKPVAAAREQPREQAVPLGPSSAAAAANPALLPRWVKRLNSRADAASGWPLTLSGRTFATPRALWSFCSDLLEVESIEEDLPPAQRDVLLQLLRLGLPNTKAACTLREIEKGGEGGGGAAVRVVVLQETAGTPAGVPGAFAVAPGGTGAAGGEEAPPARPHNPFKGRSFALLRPSDGSLHPFTYHRAMHGLFLNVDKQRGGAAAAAAVSEGEEEAEEEEEAAAAAAEPAVPLMPSSKKEGPFAWNNAKRSNGGGGKKGVSPPLTPLQQQHHQQAAVFASAAAAAAAATATSPSAERIAMAAAGGEPRPLPPLPPLPLTSRPLPLPVRPRAGQLSGWATQAFPVGAALLGGGSAKAGERH